MNSVTNPRKFDLEEVKREHAERINKCRCDYNPDCPCDLAATITELETVPPVHELTGHPMVGWAKLCGGLIEIHDPIVFSANEGLVTCTNCLEKIAIRTASRPARTTDGRFTKRETQP